MGAFLRPLFKPLIRFVVGMIAIPLFRLFLKRVVRVHELDQELEKDLEQWFRGSLLLLVATANMEEALFGWIPIDFGAKGDVIGAALRLMLAIGVTEAMPDQELFSILHPGPPKLSFPKGRRWQACREQCWPLLRGILCQHLNRSSQVFAILAAVFVGPAGWVCYGLAISQYLIIGLVTSKDKVLDVLSEFDKQVERRRQWLLDELQESAAENEGLPIAEAALRPAVSRQPANSLQPHPADHGAD
jgi:hypothetical protein